MYRYLITFVLNKQSSEQDILLFPKVFSIKNACSPDEVTVPENTVFFFFMNTAASTVAEVESAFLGVRLGGKMKITCSLPHELENNKFFFIGKKKNIGGVEVIFNDITHSCVPTKFLNNNCEVIDL